MSYLKAINDSDLEAAIIGGGFLFIKIRQNCVYSILEGEYYFDFENCGEILNELDSKIESISKSSAYILSNTKIQKLADQRKDLLSHFISHFKYINTMVVNRLSNNYHSKIINFELEFYFNNFNLFEKDATSTLEKFHWLFIANIKLAEFDEGYSVNEKNISSLLDIYHKLKIILEKNPVYSLKPLIVVTKEKCSILLYKILKRLEKTNLLEKTSVSIYSVLNDDISIEKLELSIQNRNVIEDIKNHYFLNNQTLIEDQIDSIKNKLKNKTIEIKDIHQYSKFIKNIDFDSIVITEIKQLNASLQYFLENKIKNCDQPNGYLLNVNQITYRTSLNLIYNANFKIESELSIRNIMNSFIFNDLVLTFEGLVEYYHILKRKESESNPNFILSKLFVEQIIRLLEICDKQSNNVLNNEEDDFLNLLNRVFKKAYTVLGEYKNQIKKCELNRIMPLYLEIEKCNTNNKFFLDSQYILPSNYEHLLNDCENKRDNIKQLETIITTIIPKNIKDLSVKLKKDVKDQQYSIITVVGLYASFITFILANINVLPELIKYSIGAVFGFMLIFGVVLASFVLSLKILFTEKEKEYRTIWLVSFFALIFGALFALWYYSNSGFNKMKQETISTQTNFNPQTGKKESEVQTTKTESILKEDLIQKE